MTHPYADLPDYAFWKRAVCEDVDPVVVVLRLLPAGDRTVADALPEYTNVIPNDEEPLDEQPYLVVGEAVRQRLEAVPAVLLELSNGDTPCFLAVAPDVADRPRVQANAGPM